jgi:ADP-dependent NAD(P)H-hydrate dehydratase / NAD(P)H-hydrate epimerase
LPDGFSDLFSEFGRMKILSSSQIREADRYTIENEPVLSVDLMERAGRACAAWLNSKFKTSTLFTAVCGTGNNGGDGLVIARLLSKQGYHVSVIIVPVGQGNSKDFEANLNRLSETGIIAEYYTKSKTGFTNSDPKHVIIDSILGSGLSRPLEGVVLQVVQMINDSGNQVISIDMPSGLFSEKSSQANMNCIIRADHTLVFNSPRLALLMADNESYSGDWVVLPIGLHKSFIENVDCKYFTIEAEHVSACLKMRNKFAHKGHYGHALLVSGSYGKMGATILSAKGLLRSGAGLLTIHIPACGYSILQASVPEAMVETDSLDHCLSDCLMYEKYNAVGVGPGIGMESETQQMLKMLIQECRLPMVLDADAINILADNPTWLSFVRKGSILTPHQGEFERLYGKCDDDFERLDTLREAAIKYGHFIILKGSHSRIACPDGTVWFNTTGNPGMATAGSGDVLAGIITGLLAQGYTPKESCIMGVYIHGLAGDLGSAFRGQYSLTAGDITEYIGKAFLHLQQ